MKSIALKLSWLPVLFLLVSCWKEPVYPNEPSITMNSISTREVIQAGGSKELFITVAVGFKDGNGDMGLSPTDTLPPYNFAGGSNKFYHNFFVEPFIEINGAFEPYRPPFTYNGRYLVLNPNDKSQTLEGELRYTFSLTPALLPFDFKNGDQMKFRLQIADRALNLSNIVETEPIRVFF